MFKQHEFKASFLGVPTIQIREDVLQDMWHVTDIVQMEVGWFCTVKDLGENKFLLDGLYLPAQDCHGTTSEITPAGEAKMMNDIMNDEQAAGIEPGNPAHKLNRLDAWFHSHVEMETFPSSQDLDQMEKYRATGRPYFIRGIVNKKGKISLAFYDSRSCLKGFRVEECPWEIVAAPTPRVDPYREAWRTQITEKVSKLGYGGGVVTQRSQHPYGNDWQSYRPEDGEYWDRNRGHVPQRRQRGNHVPGTVERVPTETRSMGYDLDN